MQLASTRTEGPSGGSISMVTWLAALNESGFVAAGVHSRDCGVVVVAECTFHSW